MVRPGAEALAMMAMPQVAVGGRADTVVVIPVAALVLPADRNSLARCEFVKPIPTTPLAVDATVRVALARS